LLILNGRCERISGFTVPGSKTGRSVAELVQDIVEHPQAYYFNVHTLASYTYWYPSSPGVCRGPLQLQTATATTVVDFSNETNASSCYRFTSRMVVSDLQDYSGNVDSQAWGYSSFTLCSNGTLVVSAYVFAGTSQIVAMRLLNWSEHMGSMVIDFCICSNGTSQSQGGCPNYSDGWSVPPEILVGVGRVQVRPLPISSRTLQHIRTTCILWSTLSPAPTTGPLSPTTASAGAH